MSARNEWADGDSSSRVRGACHVRLEGNLLPALPPAKGRTL